MCPIPPISETAKFIHNKCVQTAVLLLKTKTGKVGKAAYLCFAKQSTIHVRHY